MKERKSTRDSTADPEETRKEQSCFFSASGKGRSLKNREIKKYMALFFNRQNVQA